MAATLVNLAKLIPLVQPYAPGFAQPIMSQALRLAAHDFCAATRAWRHQMTVSFAAATAALIPPTYSMIVRIERATFGPDKLELLPVQWDAIDGLDATETGPPRFIGQVGDNTAVIAPFSAGDVALSVFLAPLSVGSSFGADAASPLSNAYDVAPDFIVDAFGEALSWGALSRLYRIPGRETTNPQIAVDYERRCQQVVSAQFARNTWAQVNAPRRSRSSFY
jgi:hypothetical protein